MRQLWEEAYDTGYDEEVLSQLARLLFMKRKRVESADASELDLAFASQNKSLPKMTLPIPAAEQRSLFQSPAPRVQGRV